jgi:hypothetical protein
MFGTSVRASRRDTESMTLAPESLRHVRAHCWCCGKAYDDEDLIHLGSHPEVGICHGCAKFLHRKATQADDRLRRSPGARLRDVIRAARAQVVQGGWHDRRVVGGSLRWIDRHLP